MMRIAVWNLRPLRRHWRLGLAAAIALAAWPAWQTIPSSARGGTNPNILWYVPTADKVVALTFDDGPSREYTPQILSILKSYHATATFFVLGRQAQKYPELVRSEVRAGMEVGNHTYAHLNMKQHSVAANVADLTKAQKLLTTLIGHPPRWMRPPYGAYNAGVITAAQSLHMGIALWSWTEDSRDWANPGRDTIVARVVRHIQPGDIVLFHDGGGNRQETVAALPIILKDLHALGYHTVTISQLVQYRRSDSVPPSSVPAPA